MLGRSVGETLIFSADVSEASIAGDGVLTVGLASFAPERPHLLGLPEPPAVDDDSWEGG
ncbi:MAG: hypothetical protein IH921_11515, partial [Gemmatimonadetes bacterium]|nr:hypothetical protein [Gemmatimonadota bacterium]